MRTNAALLCLAISLAPVAAHAEPSATLVADLRKEQPATRTMLRDMASFCKEAILPTRIRRDGPVCADKVAVVRPMISMPAVQAAFDEIQTAKTDVVLSSMSSLEEGRAAAGRATPLYINFLSALDEAEKPPSKKAGKK